MTENQKQKILGSLFLSKNLKDELISKWDAFSSKKQEAILQMLDSGEQMENFLFERAAFENPLFPEEMKTMVQGQKAVDTFDFPNF